MKCLATVFGVCLIAAATSTTALGQCNTSGSYYGHHPYYGAATPWHHHSATAAEGYARGVAAILHAQGAYHRMAAEARIAHAQAYAVELENRQRHVDTFFNVRATNRRAQAAERGERPTFEELAKMAKDSAPPRLDDLQLDPESGQIHWPAALLGEKYAGARAQLEQLFSYRAATGTIDAGQRQQAQQLTGLMLVELKGDIRQMSPMEYSQARRFLGSLGHEAQLPVA